MRHFLFSKVHFAEQPHACFAQGKAGQFRQDIQHGDGRFAGQWQRHQGFRARPRVWRIIKRQEDLQTLRVPCRLAAGAANGPSRDQNRAWRIPQELMRHTADHDTVGSSQAAATNQQEIGIQSATGRRI